MAELWPYGTVRNIPFLRLVPEHPCRTGQGGRLGTTAPGRTRAPGSDTCIPPPPLLHRFLQHFQESGFRPRRPVILRIDEQIRHFSGGPMEFFLNQVVSGQDGIRTGETNMKVPGTPVRKSNWLPRSWIWMLFSLWSASGDSCR